MAMQQDLSCVQVRVWDAKVASCCPNKRCLSCRRTPAPAAVLADLHTRFLTFPPSAAAAP